MWRVLPPDETRDRLLAALLSHVPFDGWSQTALEAAAKDLDLDPDAARSAFPGGPIVLIEYHAADADRRLDEMQKDDPSLAEMRVRERIAHAVRLRLEQNAQHREAIRAALPILAQPQNGPRALRSLYRTVDTIWFGIGDSSTDFNFYTKRALLAGVYLSTLLYWLNDRSEDTTETWAFLDRRIEDIMRIQTMRSRFARFRPPGGDLLRSIREGARAAASRSGAARPR
jgi:ubiquinone biosynthesis protein COQ9